MEEEQEGKLEVGQFVQPAMMWVGLGGGFVLVALAGSIGKWMEAAANVVC